MQPGHNQQVHGAGTSEQLPAVLADGSCVAERESNHDIGGRQVGFLQSPTYPFTPAFDDAFCRGEPRAVVNVAGSVNTTCQ